MQRSVVGRRHRAGIPGVNGPRPWKQTRPSETGASRFSGSRGRSTSKESWFVAGTGRAAYRLPVDRSVDWAFSGKWHRRAALPTTSLCGVDLTGLVGVEIHAVVADVAESRTTVCGTCDRLNEGSKSKSANGLPRSSMRERIADRRERELLERLTPEQQEIYKRRKAEKVRRAEARKIEEESHASRSSSKSIRTVSGGLPGLGSR